MLTAYACDISVRMHIQSHNFISDVDRNHLDSMLLRYSNFIYSFVYSLAFKCYGLYDSVRAFLEKSFPRQFIYLDNDFIIKCHESTDMLEDGCKHGEKIMHDFMAFCVKSHNLIEEIQKGQPTLVWVLL